MTPVLKRAAEARGSLTLPVQALPRTPQPVQPVVDRPAVHPAPRTDGAMPAAELQALREQAAREGFAQGRQAAEKELRAALERQAEQWRSSLNGMSAALEEHRRNLEQAAVAIAFEALGNVLGHAYVQGEAVAAAVRQLLQRSPAAPELTVVVPPHALEALRQSLDDENRVSLQQIRLKVDPTLAPSACRVVNERGVLESDLSVQLRAILDALLQAHQAVAGDSR